MRNDDIRDLVELMEEQAVNFNALMKMLDEKELFDKERFRALRKEEREELQKAKVNVSLQRILTTGILRANRSGKPLAKEEGGTDG